MDFASLIGIVSDLSLIISAIFIGGNLESFINVPGLMIVLWRDGCRDIIDFSFSRCDVQYPNGNLGGCQPGDHF